MEIPELDEDISCRKGSCYDDDQSLRTLSPDAREAMHSQAQKLRDKKLSVIVSVHEDNELSDFSDHDDDKSQATLQTGRSSSRIKKSKRKEKREKKRKKNQEEGRNGCTVDTCRSGCAIF